uniref:Uncharacterized protein n=1 Tax=Anguilla anguilla TaxID=7936 RepID=A0A0E9QMQ2_ANGAN
MQITFLFKGTRSVNKVSKPYPHTALSHT